MGMKELEDERLRIRQQGDGSDPEPPPRDPLPAILKIDVEEEREVADQDRPQLEKLAPRNLLADYRALPWDLVPVPEARRFVVLAAPVDVVRVRAVAERDPLLGAGASGAGGPNMAWVPD